jgi:hypothetical protein
VDPRADLEAGWTPEPIWRLGGPQSWSGGWVDTRTCLEAEWTPEHVWRLGGLQSWSGGWVDPRTCVDDMEKWKFLLLPGLELGLLGHPVRKRYDCRIVSDK